MAGGIILPRSQQAIDEDLLSDFWYPMTETNSKPLSARVRLGALWNVATTLVLRMASILITAIVAHILAPKDFGVFAVALTAYAIVSAIGELGVASCLIRADLDIDSLAPTMASVSLATSALLAGAMAIFAGPIAAALGSVHAAGPVRVMAFAVILTGVFAVPSAQLVRDFKQDKLFLANIISFIPSTAALLILAKSGSGAMAFAWSRVIGQLVVGCVLVVTVSKHYRPGMARSALSLLFKFGIPLAAANFVNYILLNVDYALIGHLMGAVALGIYVLAFNVASWPSTLLGTMINNVAMPAFSRVKHDADLLQISIINSLRSLSIVVLPMCSLIMALARPLVLTLYGSKWTASASVLSVLTLYSAISVICLLFANILAGMGRTKFLLAVQIIWLGALAPAMAIGVHQDGIVGAAFAHIIVIGPIVLPCYLFAAKRTTGVSLRALGKAVVPALVASLAAAIAAKGAAMQFSNPLAQLAAGLASGGLVYVLVIAPQVIALLDQGKATKFPIKGLLRLHAVVSRSLRLPIGNRPKHAGNSGSGYARQIPKHASHDRSSGLVLGFERWQDDARSQDAVVPVAGWPPGLADAYDQYAAPLYGYCHWMLKKPTDAADAVERTFAATAAELGDLRDLDEVRPWLYRAARDECYRRMRATGYFWSTNFASQPADFSGVSAHAELRTLTRTILGELKPHQREIVELSLRRGLSDADLAIVLGVSWNQASALSSRARSHLEVPLRAMLVARTGREDCPVLNDLLAGSDGQLTEQTRGLVIRHIGQCQTCADHMPAVHRKAWAVLLPSAAPPLALRERVMRRCAEVTPDTLTNREQMTRRSKTGDSRRQSTSQDGTGVETTAGPRWS